MSPCIWASLVMTPPCACFHAAWCQWQDISGRGCSEMSGSYLVYSTTCLLMFLLHLPCTWTKPWARLCVTSRVVMILEFQTRYQNTLYHFQYHREKVQHIERLKNNFNITRYVQLLVDFSQLQSGSIIIVCLLTAKQTCKSSCTPKNHRVDFRPYSPLPTIVFADWRSLCAVNCPKLEGFTKWS